MIPLALGKCARLRPGCWGWATAKDRCGFASLWADDGFKCPGHPEWIPTEPRRQLRAIRCATWGANVRLRICELPWRAR